MFWNILNGGDLRSVLIEFLIALPACLLAISAHESAHGWVAYRCGDHTAYNLGRITLNPVKHFDPIGTTMLILFGFGWARPVPVVPRNYKHYRRDDLLVSLAGIAMNLILALLGAVLLFVFVGAVLASIATDVYPNGADAIFMSEYLGMQCVIFNAENTYLPASMFFRYAFYSITESMLITPVAGQVAGILFRMLTYFVTVNLSLAVFNLIPIPPLDGYHVLNDLILKKRLFVKMDTERITRYVLLALIATDYIFPRIGLGAGLLDRALNFVLGNALQGLGMAAEAVFKLFV